MFRSIAVALVVVIVASPAFSAPPSKTATKVGAAQVPLHVQAAQQLVAEVALSDTTYDHGKGVVHWKGRDGAAKSECHTDCSGLLNNLLEAAYGVTESDRREWLGTGRPTAKVYHDAIAAGNRFQRITNVSQLLPGDVLAAKYVSGENTGHVMIVASAPQPRQPSAPLVPNTQQWELVIIDSSMSGHGNTDTRRLPNGKYTSRQPRRLQLEHRQRVRLLQPERPPSRNGQVEGQLTNVLGERAPWLLNLISHRRRTRRRKKSRGR